jgi:hypothetical protein
VPLDAAAASRLADTVLHFEDVEDAGAALRCEPA